MIQYAVDEILPENKDKNIGAKNDTSDYHEHENTRYGINKPELYEQYKLSFDEMIFKVKKCDVSMHLKAKSKIFMI